MEHSSLHAFFLFYIYLLQLRVKQNRNKNVNESVFSQSIFLESAPVIVIKVF